MSESQQPEKVLGHGAKGDPEDVPAALAVQQHVEPKADGRE